MRRSLFLLVVVAAVVLAVAAYVISHGHRPQAPPSPGDAYPAPPHRI